MAITKIELTDTSPLRLNTSGKIMNDDYVFVSNPTPYQGAVEEAHTITYTTTDGKAIGAKFISASDIIKVLVVPDDGYTLPVSITVTGATNTYDTTTGIITLSQATADVVIEAECGPEAAETWVINETPDVSTANTYAAKFSSTTGTGVVRFTALIINNANALGYRIAGGADMPVYSEGAWVSQDARTITFDIAPTGDLLTWLQANAVKQ